MTGCLFISPPRDADLQDYQVITAILADTRRTIKRENGEGQLVVPANLSVDNYNVKSSAMLVRKANIFGSVAVALAGNAKNTSYILNSMENISEEIQNSNVPATLFRQKVEAFNLTVPEKDRVEFIASCVVGDLKNNSIQTSATNGRSIMGSLGACSAIGTGAKDLIGLCNIMEPELRGDSNFSRCIKMQAWVNGIQLAKELVGEPTNDWGGFTELLYWNGSMLSWEYGPPALHLFYHAAEVAPAEFSAVPYVRALMYAPEGEFARILSVSALDGASAILNCYIDSAYKSHPQKKSADFKNFWVNWKPGVLAVTMIVQSTDLTFRYAVHMVAYEEIEKYLEFGISEDKISWRLDSIFVDEVAKPLFDWAGVEYEPSKSEIISFQI